jgi:hypothetical protein
MCQTLHAAAAGGIQLLLLLLPGHHAYAADMCLLLLLLPLLLLQQQQVRRQLRRAWTRLVCCLTQAPLGVSGTAKQALAPDSLLLVCLFLDKHSERRYLRRQQQSASSGVRLSAGDFDTGFDVAMDVEREAVRPL